MLNHALVKLARLLLWAVLVGTAALGLAQAQKPAQKPKLTITDAAGRVHVRPMRQRITVAQRKAAAQQRKANRTQAAPHGAATVPSSEVKK